MGTRRTADRDLPRNIVRAIGRGHYHKLGDVMKFGERIRDLRKAKHLSLDKLAALSSCSKSYLWELENKNPPRPSADKLSAIAESLSVTVDYLFGRDSQSIASAEDEAFFRRYKALPVAMRAKIRAMTDVMAPALPGNDRLSSHSDTGE